MELELHIVMTKKQKEWVINASYYSLLKRWRFAKDNDSIFQGESGKFYIEQMSYKKAQLDFDECVRISKQIGWDNG